MEQPEKQSSFGRGSQEARAIAKGLKEKELQDSIKNFLMGGAFVIAIILGLVFHSFWIGLIVLIVIAIPITKWYYKE